MVKSIIAKIKEEYDDEPMMTIFHITWVMIIPVYIFGMYKIMEANERHEQGLPMVVNCMQPGDKLMTYSEIGAREVQSVDEASYLVRDFRKLKLTPEHVCKKGL